MRCPYCKKEFKKLDYNKNAPELKEGELSMWSYIEHFMTINPHGDSECYYIDIFSNCGGLVVSNFEEI